MKETIKSPGLSSQLQDRPKVIPTEKLRIENILCPVDFSEFSETALRYAAGLAFHFGARLYLHHTVQFPKEFSMGVADAAFPPEAFQAKMTEEKDRLNSLAKTVAMQLPDIVPIVREGDPISNILEIIRARNIDLLVIGTHGHKGFNRLVLGSVTEQVIHEASCPVLVVSRPKRGFLTPSRLEPLPLRTIVLATDFSPSSDRALAYALRWASEWGGKVILFHAVEEVPAITHGRVDLFPELNPAFEQQIAAAWEKVRRLIPEAAEKTCEVVCEVRHGRPREEILRVAEERAADLIVMGARGQGAATTPWGSNSSAVVRAGTFPVLVVRQLPA